MAPPAVTGIQSVQFQQVMQPQMVESPQIISTKEQQNFQSQIQQINHSMQQSFNENQQKLNGMPFSIQNPPQPVSFSQQVRLF